MPSRVCLIVWIKKYTRVLDHTVAKSTQTNVEAHQKERSGKNTDQLQIFGRIFTLKVRKHRFTLKVVTQVYNEANNCIEDDI